jgi:hypothetical protein
MLGAFLSLLLDHFVHENDAAEKLALSKSSQALQMDQMWVNSPVLQYLYHGVQADPKFQDSLVGCDVDNLVSSFMAWRIAEGHEAYTSADVLSMFRDYFEIYFKTVRLQGKTPKRRTIKALKQITTDFFAQIITEGGDDEDIAELVAD